MIFKTLGISLFSASSGDNAALLNPITDEEIWLITKSIGALKAPGPDGLSARFFHDCSDIIKDSVISMVKKIFIDHALLSQFNHTNIALIPKVENPEVVRILGLLVCVM